jgi:hypothetical protein
LTSVPSSTRIPDVFIKSGTYKNGALHLQISNRKKITAITVAGNSRNTEVATFKSTTEAIKLSGRAVEDIVLRSGNLFDIGLSISHAGNPQIDALYLADGAWGTDYATESASLVQLNVTASANTHTENVWQIERNPTVKGQVKGIVNLFRNAKAGNKPQDISRFTHLTFHIQCSHPVEVILVDTSLQAWEDRARFSITNTPQTRTFSIPLKSFKNGTGKEAVLKALKTLVFSVKGNDRQFSNFTLSVSNVQFNNAKEVVSKPAAEAIAFPNPFSRFTTLSFPVQTQAGYLVITDLSGRQVTNKQIQTYNGEYSFDAMGLKKGMYFFSLHELTGTKSTGKFIIQ